MGKVLRLFIVLLFILSVVALVLGVQLFGARTEITERTQRLEQAFVSVTERLTAAREPHIRRIDRRIDPEMLRDPAQIESTERVVRTIVDNRLDELSNSQEQLRTRTSELAEARSERDRAQQTAREVEGRIAGLERQVEQARAEAQEAQAGVEGHDEALARRDVTIRELNEEIARIREERDDLTHELERERLLGARTRDVGDPAVAAPVGLTGEIILVEPDWNFVILNIGSNQGLSRDAELLVHRDDTLVGRLRVTRVSNRIAVANIERETRLADVLEGDSVFFPGG